MTSFEKSIPMRIVRWIVIRAGWYRIAAWLCAREMRQRRSDGTRIRASGPSTELTILALTAYKFRGDLNDLASLPDIRLLEMPHVWQTRMLRTHYKGRISGPTQFRPETDPVNELRQKRYRAFLREFLTRLYREFSVGCVIAADVRYREDVDIGAVSKDLGVPYLVFHRECMLASRVLYQAVFSRNRMLGRFPGTAIIVHNEISRQNFVESGFADPDRVEVLGSARMDGYLRKIHTEGRMPSRRPLVVLFSFVHYQSTRQYPKSVFDKAHVAMARVAERNPHVDVIVKPKREVFNKSKWQEFYREALDGVDLAPEKLPNLTVEPNANAQELILRASVVCSINSTALLEAGIAGVPVVVPCFKEIQGDDYRDRINFREELDLFDVASDVDDMVALIEKHLRQGEVSEAELKARQALFERYVSPIGGGAAERYRAAIFKYVKEAGAPFRLNVRETA